MGLTKGEGTMQAFKIVQAVRDAAAQEKDAGHPLEKTRPGARRRAQEKEEEKQNCCLLHKQAGELRFSGPNQPVPTMGCSFVATRGWYDW